MFSNRAIKPIELLPILGIVEDEANHVHTNPADPALLNAQLADLYRDAECQPHEPQEFVDFTRGLDAEDWNRLALIIGCLEHEEFEEAFLDLQTHMKPQTQIGTLFAKLAQEKPLLPVELLCLSEVRLEEFARNLLFWMNMPIEGETARQSKKRLKELDYNLLLGEAKRAEEAAQERLEELRRLQEEERMNNERSKW